MNKDNFFDTWLDIDIIEKKKIKKEKKNENNNNNNVSNATKPGSNGTHLL
jgi:hypothetical protein